MRSIRMAIPAAFSALALFVVAVPAFASHSWDNYHWARESNPFTLKLGDNVTDQWDAYLDEASADWSTSTVLDTTIVPGSVPVKQVKQCAPPSGRVEVCNSKYGNNGWLGVAGIYLTGGHIYKGYVKMNDFYFNTATYNKPEWRRFVMCQEIGHTFGLDHQDETFNNLNRGTCMDYTNDPSGSIYNQLSNEHPNAHDYEQLDTIYNTDPSTSGHADSTTTVGQSTGGRGNSGSRSRVVDVDEHGNGTITWVFWKD